jgi:hypothetical protein
MNNPKLKTYLKTLDWIEGIPSNTCLFILEKKEALSLFESDQLINETKFWLYPNGVMIPTI